MLLFDWLDTFFSDLQIWLLLLPKWGIWSLLLIGANIFSRIGLLASVGFMIIIWNALGREWGLIALIGSLGLSIIYIGLATIFKWE